MVRGLKQRCPSVHLKAFTMVEVAFFSRIAKISIEEVLQKMKEAGVDSCPGGGAEIFHPRVRKIICDHKTSGQMWLNTARKTHQAGLHSNATMLYGHVETEEERVDHLVKLRELQDETHGFVAFIPLAFHPDNTALSHIPKPTGYADLRNIAVVAPAARQFRSHQGVLDHADAEHRADRAAIRRGRLDGTVVEEKIYHDAGAKTSEFTPRAELERLIRAAGRVPVERDTLYRPVDRSKMPPIQPPPPPDLVSLTAERVAARCYRNRKDRRKRGLPQLYRSRYFIFCWFKHFWDFRHCSTLTGVLRLGRPPSCAQQVVHTRWHIKFVGAPREVFRIDSISPEVFHVLKSLPLAVPRLFSLARRITKTVRPQPPHGA